MNIKYFNFIGAITAAIALSACNASSPTYGTGATNQEHTIKGIANMLALSPEDAPDINYNTRPDLVVPANQGVLPQPVETQALAHPADWPETPEQRIAAARANAPQAHERSGELPIEFLSDTNKAGIAKESAYRRLRDASSRQNSSDARISREIREEAQGKNTARAEVLAKRDQLAYSTGIKRKFLTEPPTEYRTPSANAEAGDLGVTNEEIQARLKKQKKDKFNSERGTIDSGAND